MKYIKYIAGAFMIASCTPDSSDMSLGTTAPVSFEASVLPNNPNRVAVKNTSAGTFMSLWYTGGASPVARRDVDTLTLTKKGEYTISLVAYSGGGSASASKKITIASDMPLKELVKGGDMSAASAAEWTVPNTGGQATTLTWEGGKLKYTNVTGAGSVNGAIFQKIAVKKDKEYIFSAMVKGGGMAETWFQVYFSPEPPGRVQTSVTILSCLTP